MYEHVLAQPLTVGDDDRLQLAPSPFAVPAVRRRGFLLVLPAAESAPTHRRRRECQWAARRERKSNVFTCRDYGDLRGSRLRSSENPLVDFYKNVKLLF